MPALQLGNAQTRITYPIIGTLLREVSQADVVQANTPAILTAAALLLAHRQNVPVVVGVHTQIETSTLQLPRFGGLVAGLLRRWYRWLFSRADLLVAPTEFAAATSRAFSNVRVVVVSNGIDYASYARQRGATTGRQLTYLGRLSAEKRPQDLLKLLQALPPDYHLVIAGTGPLAAELAERVQADGLAERVRLAGFVDEDEKRTLLAQTDLFVMPSPAELQSIATLEAMAAGCAVVAFDYASSAVPKLVTEAQAGVVVPTDDACAQAAVVAALLTDQERLRAAQESAQRYAALHDVARSADSLVQRYLELTRARR
jgi:glycosyltransferase involved in cell wall biosynthesis